MLYNSNIIARNHHTHNVYNVFNVFNGFPIFLHLKWYNDTMIQYRYYQNKLTMWVSTTDLSMTMRRNKILKYVTSIL